MCYYLFHYVLFLHVSIMFMCYYLHPPARRYYIYIYICSLYVLFFIITFTITIVSYYCYIYCLYYLLLLYYLHPPARRGVAVPDKNLVEVVEERVLLLRCCAACPFRVLRSSCFAIRLKAETICEAYISNTKILRMLRGGSQDTACALVSKKAIRIPMSIAEQDRHFGAV